MKFLVDAQLPPALSRWLCDSGWDSKAVRELGLRDADDTTIWMHAEMNGLVIVTKDEDFARRVQATVTGPAVVWLRMGNTSNPTLRAWLVPRMPQIVSLLQQGARLVEIR